MDLKWIGMIPNENGSTNIRVDSSCGDPLWPVHFPQRCYLRTDTISQVEASVHL
jgi:hypothetical protein